MIFLILNSRHVFSDQAKVHSKIHIPMNDVALSVKHAVEMES